MKNKNQYKEALYYNRLHKDISDSIYNKSKVAAINNLEVLYQTNQKKKKLSDFGKKYRKELQLVKRNQLLWITGIIIGALLIIFFIHLRNSKYNRMITKQEQLIQDQK